MDKNIILTLALLLLILILVKIHVKMSDKTEYFDNGVTGEESYDDSYEEDIVQKIAGEVKKVVENSDPNTDNTKEIMEIINKNYNPKGENDWAKIKSEIDKCTKQYEWWDTKPIQSILSRYTGIGLNVCPIEQDCDIGTPEGNINSSYTISLNVPSVNKTLKSGVITVNPDGTYSLDINMNSLSQRWKVIKIDNAKTFNKYLPQSQYVNDNDLGRVPFWSVIKEPVLEGTSVTDTNQNRVLQYENGSISVRLLSNYEAQKWVISPNKITKPIGMISNNLHSSMTPEFTDIQGQKSLSQITDMNNQSVMSGINKVYELLMKQNKLSQPSETEFGKKPLTLNLRLGGDSSALGGENQDTFTGGYTPGNNSLNKAMDVTARLNAYEYEKDKVSQKKKLDDLIKEGQGLECKIPNFEDYATQSDLASCYGCSNL